jgi:hypothetical protein
MFNWSTNKSKQQPPTSISSSPTFGVKLPEDNKVAAVELKNITESFVKRNKTIETHLNKASKDRELANKLAANYIHNYYVMIDISVLLNQYAEFFNTIKDVLANSDIQVEQLNAQNFQNLERLTRQEMDKFTSKFTEQATKVKKLFETYNMTEQAAKLSAVPTLTSQVGIAAEEALKALPPKYGGGRKKHLRKQLDKIVNGGRKNKSKERKTSKK